MIRALRFKISFYIKGTKIMKKIITNKKFFYLVIVLNNDKSNNNNQNLTEKHTQ